MIGTRVSTLRLFRSAHASMALTSASPTIDPLLINVVVHLLSKGVV
jgi:hypothetical protein